MILALNRFARRVLLATFGTVWLVFTSCTFVCAQPESAATKRELSSDEARLKALDFLGRANLHLTQQGFESWGTLRGKGRKCYHFGGLPAEDLAVDVDTSSGEVRVYRWIRQLGESQKISVTSEQAEQRARAFLAKHTGYNSDATVVLVGKKLLDHGGGGKEYSFEWKRIVNGVEYPFGLSMQVSAQTGEVIGYLVVERALPANLTPTISKDRAIQIATPHCDLEAGYSTQATLYVWDDLKWRVVFKGRKVLPYNPQDGQIAYDAHADVVVNGTTGTIEESQTFHVEPRRIVQLKPPDHPTDYTASDHWPVLTPDPVRPAFFLTSRKGGRYDWLLASLGAKQLNTVFAAPGFIRSCSWAASSQRMAFGMYGTLYILDLKSGTLGQCNDPERARRTMPSWDNTGHLLAMSGTHSPSDGVGSDDSDIFVARIASQLSRVSMESNWCASVLPGEDVLPVFSPDGKRLAFAHQEVVKAADGAYHPVAGEKNWSIYLITADRAKRDKNNKPTRATPRKLVGGLPAPERLSWFPDGKRLLVSFSGNEYEMTNPPQFVDVVARSLKPLGLPVLHDPDLAQGRSLIVRELCLSPDGKRIAFAALRWTGKPKDSGAICIYACNVDGSGLKRLTPPGATPLQPLQYPRAGITALNAWSKLEPKPNLGTLMTQQQIAAERALRDGVAPQ